MGKSSRKALQSTWLGMALCTPQSAIPPTTRQCQGGTRCPQRVGKVIAALPPDISVSDEKVWRRLGEADPPLCAICGYFSSSFTYANAFVANSKSSRECAAETCVRTRAVPCGTTG